MATDPWAENDWGDAPINMTFETDIFDFEAEANSPFGMRGGTQDFETASQLFPNDPMWDMNISGEERKERKKKSVVQVAIHEQLSALYDDVSKKPSCQVDGTIVVKPSRKSPAKEPYCLIVRDLFDKIEGLELNDVCTNITDLARSRKGLHKSDTILKVSAPKPSEFETEIAVASYTCTPKLRPVPMLVKSRIERTSRHRRVGFKIRANPHNKASLQQIVIMLAVPPCVDGPSVKMTRRGGIWDEMKRTVSWIIDTLEPGAAIEVQAQFEAIEGSSQKAQFPVLVRADYQSLFSAVEVTTADIAGAGAIDMKLHESARIIHRKM